MANEWNASKRFLKVAIDSDGDLGEYLSVSVLGNMTFDNFKNYIGWYDSMDAALYKYIEAKRPAKGGKPTATAN